MKINPRHALRLTLVLAMGLAPGALAEVNPVRWEAKVIPSTVRAGSPAEVLVEARIDEGWYIYSATQGKGGPIATEVSLSGKSLLISTGAVKQGKFAKKRDEAFGVEVEAFTGRARFELPAIVAADARPGEGEARVRVFYQACNGRICLMPAEQTLTARFTVAPASGASKSAPPSSRGNESARVSRAKPDEKATSGGDAEPAKVAIEPAASSGKETPEAPCPVWISLRQAFQELAVISRSDRDRAPAVLECAIRFLESRHPSDEEAYFGALLRLRPRQGSDGKRDEEQALALLREYLKGTEPLYFEESALANLVSVLARRHEFEEAIATFERLSEKFPQSTTHDLWTDVTNVEAAAGALTRELAGADRWDDLERVARRFVGYLENVDKTAALRLGSYTSYLLEALEEKGDHEAAEKARRSLTEHFAKHQDKYSAAADMWLAGRRINKLEFEKHDAAAALRVAREARESYVRMDAARTVDATIQRLELLGKLAPAFETDHWINSPPMSLESLHGRVVLLDFWQSWCGPCREAFPKLEQLSRERMADGLVVIGVTQTDGFVRGKDGKTIRAADGAKLSFEEELGHLEKFVSDFALTMPIAVSRRREDPNQPYAGGPFQERYGIGYYPTAVVIDRDGVIRYIGDAEGDAHQKVLDELLAK